MYSLPQRNPVAPTRKRLSAFGSNSRVNLQTPGAPARLQTADRETRGSAVRRPRTGLTCSPPTTLATGPRFGFRNSSSAGRYGIVPPKTPQPESSGRCFESAGKVQPARSNTRGSTPDDHLSGLARRAQLWKPVIKPTTSSASCRPRLGLTAGSVLPTSRNRGESNLAGRLRTKLRAEAPGPLKLSTAGFCIPHPGKNGVGEDAHFYSEHAVGVADGVGGWAAHGIDAGEYARQLMKRCEESIESGNTDPVAAMWHGYKAVQSLGSSTCFVMVLDPATRVVQCANLGDSGYRHVRGSVVVSKAEVGQHYFNCPFQLGSHSGDDPDDALKPVSYTHLRAHETVLDLVCRLLLEKKKKKKKKKSTLR
eukprot:TRINITY_DN3303_c0_g3_i1.p1 TRINITY_DN3303_c0_g3~~TRINITY_DN3303_c0_g3_i1.p1  ORF type:complete len:365 (-),score=29.86 TRINITY_DN3303_c0_g3_i1:2-1096(-)